MNDLEPKHPCNALTNKGTPCPNPAMPGYPYCVNHIKSLSTNKSHDRYSTTMPSSVHSHYQHQLQDDRPKDLNEEIATLRSLLRGHFEKLQNRSLEGGEEQITMADVGVILQMTEHIGRMVERQAKVNPERIITVQDAMAIITKIIDIINEHVPRDQIEVRNRIVGSIQRSIGDMLSSAVEMPYGQTPQT